jgi:hypothetical protein
MKMSFELEQSRKELLINGLQFIWAAIRGVPVVIQNWPCDELVKQVTADIKIKEQYRKEIREHHREEGEVGNI